MPGSIAAQLGIRPGDRLLSIDGRDVPDVFDYRLRILSARLILSISRDGEVTEYDIGKSDDDDLGLEFDQPLMDEAACCDNHCVFCFIDQLPPGMRPSLYVKDDDLRLSFLTGNYITLTNLSDDQLERLIGYRLSPVNVSVHSTDPELRRRILRHPQAGELMGRLRRLSQAGLEINAQIVLCPGLNDGAHLERTLRDLTDLGPSVRSIALVPVGITRWRKANGLYDLKPFDAAGCRTVVDGVNRWQQHLLATRGSRTVYAADEFYLLGGLPLPPATDYEDYPQLENGVGMASLFDQELDDLLTDEALEDFEPIAPRRPDWLFLPAAEAAYGGARNEALQSATARLARCGEVVLLSGTLAAPLLDRHSYWLGQIAMLPVRVHPIVSRFFGPTVNVAGLLTGGDIVNQAVVVASDALLMVPTSLLRVDQPVLLDDLNLQDLADRLNRPVAAVRPEAAALCGAMAWLAAIRAGQLEAVADHVGGADGERSRG